MIETKHFKALENMYAAAPINQIYNPTLTGSQGKSEIEIALSEQYHHSAGAVHGSVYFKMLDGVFVRSKLALNQAKGYGV